MDPKSLVGGPDEHAFIARPKTKVKTYWWRGHKGANWGDWLTPLLLERFAHLEAQWAERGTANLVMVGSILGHIIGPWYTGTILGSGKLYEDAIVPPRATILALRGPLTARGVPGSYALGDPGLLADELVRVDTKRFDLCIVPHWSDTRPYTETPLAEDPQFTRYPHVIVDPFDDPLTVIAAMAQSAKVVTSSLHALILSDALNIPRRFQGTADWASDGGYFKALDYSASVGVPFKIGKLQEADPNKVIDRKTDLKDVFRAYGKHIRAASHD